MLVTLTAIQGKPEVARLAFESGEYVLGRSHECHVRIGVDNKQGVSGRHCVLTITDQDVSVRDLHSRNGTVVNSVRITSKQALRNGDSLRMGSIVFLVRTDGTYYSLEMAGVAACQIGPCDTAAILCRAVRPFPDETVNAPIDRTQG
jgi:pSer/pThr/pTyr-binding forkhead associated (FHA) protein